MTELLAVLTVVYVIYVINQIIKTIIESDGVITPASVAAVAVAPTPASTSQAVREQPVQPREPKPEAPPKASAPAQSAAAKSQNLRNPETGEISPTPGNYRFAKKWIKEAIVNEGLLSKVYKNSELNGATNGKVKEALEAFKSLEKYQA